METYGLQVLSKSTSPVTGRIVSQFQKLPSKKLSKQPPNLLTSHLLRPKSNGPKIFKTFPVKVQKRKEEEDQIEKIKNPLEEKNTATVSKLKKIKKTGRRQPSQTRQPDTEPLKPRGTQTSQIFKKLIKSSQNRYQTIKQASLKQSEQRQKIQEQKKKALKKTNDGIRRRNAQSTNRKKKKTVQHKTAWGIDQRLFNQSHQMEKISQFNQIRSRIRVERIKKMKEGRQRIGLGFLTSRKKKKKTPVLTRSAKQLRPSNPDIQRYMKVKKQKQKVQEMTQKLQQVLKQSQREKALLQLQKKQKQAVKRSLFKKKKKKHNFWKTERTYVQRDLSESIQDFQNRSNQQPVDLADQIQNFGPKQITQLQLVSPRENLQEQQSKQSWEDLESEDEVYTQSELFEQFRKNFSEKHQKIDEMFTANSRIVQQHLKELESFEQDTGGRLQSSESRRNFIPPLNMGKLKTPDDLHTHQSEYTSSYQEALARSQNELLSKKWPDNSEENTNRYKKDIFQLRDQTQQGIFSGLDQQFQKGERVAQVLEIEEPEMMEEEESSEVFFAIGNESCNQSADDLSSDDEFIAPPISSFAQDKTEELRQLDKLIESRIKASESFPVLDSKWSHLSPRTLEKQTETFIERVINLEIENFFGVIVFQEKKKEVDSSKEFLIRYLYTLKNILQEDQSEILDIINTPIQVQPLEKLYVLQEAQIGNLCKTRTLDLILDTDYSLSMKKIMNHNNTYSLGSYLQMMFDCINQALNYIRPYGTQGTPSLWSYHNRKIFRQDSIEKILELLREMMIGWIDLKGGKIPVLESEERITQIREQAMSNMLCVDVQKEEGRWLDYQDEEIQVTFDVSDMILEALLEETNRLIIKN